MLLPCRRFRKEASRRERLFYYIILQERKLQAQRDWLDFTVRAMHNVHEVDVCACSFVRVGMWRCVLPIGAGMMRLATGSCQVNSLSVCFQRRALE